MSKNMDREAMKKLRDDHREKRENLVKELREKKISKEVFREKMAKLNEERMKHMPTDFKKNMEERKKKMEERKKKMEEHREAMKKLMEEAREKKISGKELREKIKKLRESRRA